MNGPDLLMTALVYLAAGVVAVPIAQRLGLGSVLGYLVAGAVIGPFVLHVAGNAANVMHVAEFGVVIMLFLIGMEVRPSMLWRMRGVFFGLGGAQVVLTGLAVAVACRALGLSWQASVALGFILSLSSTAIVLQTFEERGLRHTQAGSAAFGILLFQDVSTIPMFAALPLLAMGAHAAPPAAASDLLAGQPPWVHALVVFAAVLLVIGAGRYLTRPVFRFIANTHSREIFTASALLLVIAVDALMRTVGLSAALGAFLAGVVLADSEFRHELESDIDPFRALLLGLFFISVGAGMNLGLFLSEPVTLIACVVGLIVIKTVVAYMAARLFGIEGRSAALMSVALAQGSEFAFVLLGLASGLGIITTRISSLATAAVAFSMALTPLGLMGYQKWCSRGLSPDAGPQPENEAFDDRPNAIIAGFGRFGQIAARLLIVNGFKTSTLEASAEQVELVRRFGRRVYYGDATRLELLQAAGAAEAQLLIVAIDDPDQAEELVETARTHFPNLKVLARAFDRRHAYRLLDKGAHVVERETFEASLTLGAEALKILGFKSKQAARAARLFRKHDLNMFEALSEVWSDEERFTIAARESSERMNELLAADIRDMLKEPETETEPETEPGRAQA